MCCGSWWRGVAGYLHIKLNQAHKVHDVLMKRRRAALPKHERFQQSASCGVLIQACRRAAEQKKPTGEEVQALRLLIGRELNHRCVRDLAE